MRFDPFRELDRMLRPWSELGGGSRWAGMPMDAYRRGDHFIAEFDIPGVDPDSIDVTVERNVLEVTAERMAQRAEDDQVLVAERPQGRVSRQLFLGEGLDAEHIEANYDHGVLVVRIPVAEGAKPHRIAVTATESQKAVEAGGS